MTHNETIAVMSVLKAAYPNFYRDMTRKDAESVVNLWEEIFRAEPVQVVAAAVKMHIASDEKGFPPHIGAIKTAVAKLKNLDVVTEQEAWNFVKKALKNSIYGAAEEFEKLPEIVKRLVGSPERLREWAMMEKEVVESVVASNFQRSYRARAEHEREYLSLPEDVREVMRQLAAGMAMPAIAEGK